MENLIQQVIDCVEKHELESALNKLKNIFTISKSNLINDVHILTGNLGLIKSDYRKGVINFSQKSQHINGIMSSILELVDEIKRKPKDFEIYEDIEKELEKSLESKKAKLPSKIKYALFERIAYVKDKEIRFKVIWIDDYPSNNLYESLILKSIGIEIDYAKSSEEALEMIKSKDYNLIISDISRNGKDDAGLVFYKGLVNRNIKIPIIFYVGNVDRNKGVPPRAFGIADLPNELIHLVLDVIERIW